MNNAYDYKPMGGNSQYLKITEKGDAVKLRIASEPFRSLRVWKESERKYIDSEKVATLSKDQLDALMRDPDFVVSELFSWKVIDRTDGNAKVISLPGSVFKKLATLANNEDWGDPTNYDITVERTENPGSNYWGITPSPNKTSLNDEELDKIEQLDIEKLVVGAEPLEQTKTPPKPTTDNEPIDPSEIPF